MSKFKKTIAVALSVIFTTVISSVVQAKVFYSITAEPERGAKIKKGGQCSSKIGAGGNLVENGQRFLGKCEGGGIVPEIFGSKPFLHHLRFKTQKNYRQEDKTRSELAIANKFFDFHKKIYVGFRMKIPHGVDYTEEFFYLMQLWQCAPAPPIAGIRLDRGPGHSHRINLMTRGDFRDSSIAHKDLKPGVWHSFVIQFVVDPRGRGGLGRVKLWVDQDGDPLVWNGRYGFLNKGKCTNGKYPPQHFRLKFGIYKGTEYGKRFEVRYDDIRVGNSYHSVQPW